MSSRARIVLPAAVASVLALAAMPVVGSTSDPSASPLGKINHIVIIYQENHSFDNLYGSWERVNGLSRASAANTLQIKEDGTVFNCLLQDDSHLTSPPLTPVCSDTTGTPANTTFTSHFFNAPFTIDSYIPSSTNTRDLVHRFYQEQYQINGGQQNRYVTGSDAVGLSMGHYDTTQLAIYQYLHQAGHPSYAIADKFFQAAFGGSFLNHQWLIAANMPTYPNAPTHSVLDDNGMPNSYPLYTPRGTVTVKDAAITEACGPTAHYALTCGNYAINTIQPPFQPTASAANPNVLRLPAQTSTTIGDELSAANVDWAWYAGGWSNADGDVNAPGWTNGSGPNCSAPNAVANPAWPHCPDNLFQFHHQPFNYYANYAPGTAGRSHLQDEQAFLDAANTSTSSCNLKSVSFVKPLGEENEHPGYTNEQQGNQHLVDLIKKVEGSACANDTMIVTTYDEFGGTWDHVSPPSPTNASGPSDQWGPGTRIPALVLSPNLNGDFVVDHVPHDTTSILATIEHRFGLAPLGTRDAAVRDLSSVYHAR